MKIGMHAGHDQMLEGERSLAPTVIAATRLTPPCVSGGGSSTASAASGVDRVAVLLERRGRRAEPRRRAGAHHRVAVEPGQRQRVEDEERDVDEESLQQHAEDHALQGELREHVEPGGVDAASPCSSTRSATAKIAATTRCASGPAAATGARCLPSRRYSGIERDRASPAEPGDEHREASERIEVASRVERHALGRGAESDRRSRNAIAAWLSSWITDPNTKPGSV